MLATELDNTIRLLRMAAVKVAWRQWAALGAPVTGGEPARAQVDAEALVFASLALGEEEKRLERVLRLWLPAGARVLSVQRFRNLMPAFSSGTQSAAARLAHLAASLGKDARWRSVASPEALKAERTDRRQLGALALDAPAAMGLKLRLGLGVGVKPDVLGYLLGRGGGRATVQELAQAVVYRSAPVRRAAEELAQAGFIEQQRTAPVSWRTEPRHWMPLLKLRDEPPHWRPWHVFYAFVDALLALVQQARGSGWSPYLHASRLRDVLEGHAQALSKHNLLFIEPEQFPGEGLLEGARVQVHQLVAWADSAV